MEIIYQAKSYSADKVRARYVRFDADGIFRFCEVGDDRRYDLRQGIVDEKKIPVGVATKARAIAGNCPGYVEWDGAPPSASESTLMGSSG